MHKLNETKIKCCYHETGTNGRNGNIIIAKNIRILSFE